MLGSKKNGVCGGLGRVPTTHRLRHRSCEAVNPIIRARQHQSLAQVIGFVLPSREQEQEDPVRADSIYETAVDCLRANARSDGLVFKENVAYGFRRNLWAMKGVGVTLSFLGTLVCLVAFATEFQDADVFRLAPLGTAALNACLLAWWLVRIRPDWVRLAGEAYAERLLASRDSLVKE